MLIEFAEIARLKQPFYPKRRGVSDVDQESSCAGSIRPTISLCVLAS